MKYEIYVGLNDKDAKVQLVSTKDAQKIASKLAVAAFGFATISLAKGVYTHDNGEIVTETTVKIELMDAENSAVINFCNALKAEFNQECIALNAIECNFNLI